MKTRNLLLGAFGLLLMASCTKDEVVDINRDGDEIAFNVVTNSSTRVFTDASTNRGGVYCNNNLPEKFYVWAITEDQTTHAEATYIDGDIIENRNQLLQQSSSSILDQAQQEPLSRVQVAGLSSWWANRCLRYWPDDTKYHLDFYASVIATSDGKEGYDANYKFDWKGFGADGKKEAPTITVNIPTEQNQQKDVLYAVKLDQHKDQTVTIPAGTTGGTPTTKKTYTVNLNFRHALSQVVFTAQNPNENLYVKVKGVSICNVNSHNTFTYPAENTETNIAHPSKETTGRNDAPAYSTKPYNNGTWGEWDSTPTTPMDYEVTLDEPLIIPAKTGEGASEVKAPVISLSGPLYQYPLKDAEGKLLTNEDGSQKMGVTEYNTKAMLLLPQRSNAWVPTAGVKPGDEAQSGTYFLVDCVIVNMAGATLDPTKDVCVWGEMNPPTETGGEPTFTTKKVAIPVPLLWKQGKKYVYNFVFGTLGGYDPDEPDPDPDLVPISFNLTVDEFEPINVESSIRDTDMAEEMMDYSKQE